MLEPRPVIPEVTPPHARGVLDDACSSFASLAERFGASALQRGLTTTCDQALRRAREAASRDGHGIDEWML